MNNKILPVALVAALLGGSAGAFMMRPSKNAEATADTAATTKSLTTVAPAHETTASDATLGADTLAANNTQTALDDRNMSSDEREAYRAGFTDGARALANDGVLASANERSVSRSRNTAPATRVVYRNATRTRAARSSNAGRVYYDYEQPRKRSFWSKHRDKLTVAGGAGGGALIGALIGGKKGAAIGALAGGGGSALYTYKLRKRNRRN
ncbi:MAG TPA: hypothetical protein VNA19_17750 [Pyrinomonadaceae bacterium]|nr:hypothetical protein [Pyrinomonadaceae bacterium]